MRKALWKLWRIYINALGIFFMAYFLVYYIRTSIDYQPINIVADKVTKVKISYIDVDNNESYTFEITDKNVLRELVNETNQLKVNKKNSYVEQDYKIQLYFSYNDGHEFYILLYGRKLIFGEDSYIVKNKERKEYLEYIQGLIEQNDDLTVEE